MPVVDIVRLGFGFALAMTVPAVAWDYAGADSDSIYGGHSTAQFDKTGSAVLSFACTRSARGAIVFLFETTKPFRVEGEDVLVPVEVDGDQFVVDAVMTDGGGLQTAMAWGYHPSVAGAVEAIFRSAGQVFVDFDGERYEFEAANGSKRFERMLKQCGRPY